VARQREVKLMTEHLSRVPNGLEPPCDVDYATARIELWSGKADIVYSDNALAGEGCIYLDLLPKPRFRFTFEAEERASVSDWFNSGRLGDAKLTASYPIGHVAVQVLASNGQSLEGSVVNESLCVPDGATSARFLIINGPNVCGDPISRGHGWYAGRLAAEVNDIQCHVDPICSDKPPKQSAFAVTHVAELRSKQVLDRQQVESLSKSLFLALSLIKSRWVGVIGPWFYSDDEKLLSAIPHATRSEGNGGSISWCHEMIRDVFPKLFPKLHEKFHKSESKEALTTGLNWLIESELCAGNVEGALILQQAALESLAWHEIVRRRKLCSEQGFERLPASDRIRWLASVFSISTEIPRVSDEIAAYAKEHNQLDLLDVLAHIRNALVHGTPKRTEALFGRTSGDNERTELWFQMGNILAQCVLAIIGYDGKILRRDVDAEFSVAAVHQVPWADSPI
jgi:hypothetical protein